MPEKTKGRGLKPEHHGELNIPSSVFPGGKEARDLRIAQLRQEYDQNPHAQREIDVYDRNSEFKQKVLQYRDTQLNGDLVKQQELEKWFIENGYENL